MPTREVFVTEVVAHPPSLLAPDIDAELVFAEDGSLRGTIERDARPAPPMELAWERVGDTYCREGRIGDEPVELACEGVTLHPGVGAKLDCRNRDDPDEYWVFDEPGGSE